MELDPKQIEAITACCEIDNRIVCVTGPAGTGKTTIIRLAYETDSKAGWSVVLCAPTGKAAKRIYEATGIDAQTIHRLLEYSHPGDPDPKTGKPVGISEPRRTRQRPLEQDCVYVDEAMMVNQELYRALLDALPPGGRVRFFGDTNQLAPIEEDRKVDEVQEAPFQVLLKNDKFKSVMLDQVYRQGADSGILLNAQNILKGKYTTDNEQWKQKYSEKPLDFLREYIMSELINNQINYADIQNQIIIPQKKGFIGTVAVNTMIQGLFHNESEPSMRLARNNWDLGEGGKLGKDGGTIKLFVNDKVICTTNLYELGVFNGESGKVIEINEETGEIDIDFGDRTQSFPPIILVQNRFGKEVEIDPRKSLALGYAITTHKAQGSEYQRVIYIAIKSHIYMLNRRNFYTGITRAREFVQLICDQRGMAASCQKRG